MSHDVFISYSSRDKPTTDAACAVLEANGLRCWIAPRDILPGRDWSEAIIDAIAEAKVFVLVFSSSANASGQIKREVERAVNRGIPIIPLRIENVAPTRSLEYFISTPHWLDAFDPPLQSHLEYLVDVIRTLLKGDPNATPAPIPHLSKAEPRSELEAGTRTNHTSRPRWPLIAAILVVAVITVGAFAGWRMFARSPPPQAAPSPAIAPVMADKDTIDGDLVAALNGNWSPQGLSCDKPLTLKVDRGQLYILWSGKTSAARIAADESSKSELATHAQDGDYIYRVNGSALEVTGPGNNIVRMTKCAG